MTDKFIFDLNKSEVINQYSFRIDEINKTGKLAFILKGNLAWDSAKEEGFEIDNIWLQSKYIKLKEGMRFDELPINFKYQTDFNLYEIWGAFKTNLEKEKKDEAIENIEKTVDYIISLNNIISFFSGASLQWYPSVYQNVHHVLEKKEKKEKKEDFYNWECVPFPKDTEHHMGIIVKDDFILNNVIPLFKDLESLPDKIGIPLKSAIDWHTEANRYAYGINRFVHYWQSIELLGNYFFKNLNADIVNRKSKALKKDNIITLMGDQNLNELNNKDFWNMIWKYCEINNPSIRTKLLPYLDLIGIGSKYEKVLFERNNSDIGLYSIRNDIVHGRISNRDFEKNSFFRKKLHLAQEVSKDIIIKSLLSSSILLEKCN